MWFSQSTLLFSLYSIGFCLPRNAILELIRSKPIAKFQSFVQVALKKAKNSCNRLKKHQDLVFSVPPGGFHSIQ